MSDYKFAYGNLMSDAIDNPFSVDISESAGSGSASAGNSAAYPAMAESAMSGKMAGAADMAIAIDRYPGYYYYGGGGWYDVYYDPFVERTYKTSADSKGYYTY